MSKRSAGILAFRYHLGALQVLLVHPGGPFYQNKDLGAWSIPKGEYGEGEEPLAVAKREFQEETGNTLPDGEFYPLAGVTLKSRKQISAWAIEANLEPPYLGSNTFELEWPPRSGRKQPFPEADRAAWFGVDLAMQKIHPGQLPLVTELQRMLS